MSDEEEDAMNWRVVMNDAEQYAIGYDEYPWPSGWVPVGAWGSKADCLDYIAEQTGKPPVSLSKEMEAYKRSLIGGVGRGRRRGLNAGGSDQRMVKRVKQIYNFRPTSV